MDILYVGQVNAGSTCAMRLAALRGLGIRAAELDTTEHTSGRAAPTRFLRRAMWRLGWPLDLERVNESLLTVVGDSRPDLVWVDKGVAITSHSLRKLRQLVPGVRLVHYNPDDPFGGFGLAGWRTFLRALPEYDIHFVPRRENIEEYERFGARRVFQPIPAWGYAPEIHRPVAHDRQRFGCDVGFVGSFEEERGQVLLSLAEAGLNVRIVGPWPSSFLHPNMQHTPDGVFGPDYATAICSFKIALGFLRKRNRDRHTSRSVEIPACGVFMLAERSEEHMALFEEGKEAEFFSSPAELLDKARFYLSHDQDRERIAAAGRQRCLASGYSNGQRMSRMLSLATDST